MTQDNWGWPKNKVEAKKQRIMFIKYGSIFGLLALAALLIAWPLSIFFGLISAIMFLSIIPNLIHSSFLKQ